MAAMAKVVNLPELVMLILHQATAIPILPDHQAHLESELRVMKWLAHAKRVNSTFYKAIARAKELRSVLFLNGATPHGHERFNQLLCGVRLEALLTVEYTSDRRLITLPRTDEQLATIEQRFDLTGPSYPPGDTRMMYGFWDVREEGDQMMAAIGRFEEPDQALQEMFFEQPPRKTPSYRCHSRCRTADASTESCGARRWAVW
ncbi:hypothetical protein LTR53_008250 [Teratosphaeriaceae sp. CCFEE 6253]|nr:hypothetical protein LTR53_008250 [Teratosphaeriaceae sp. CCFEE 6253]